jgi:hypothetical protein
MVRIPAVFYHGKSFNLVTFGVFVALAAMAGYSIAFFYLFCIGIPVAEFSWIMVLFFIFPNLVFAKIFSVFSMGRKRFFQNLRHHLNETTFYQQGGMFGFIIGALCLFYILRIPFFLLSDAICFGGFATLFIGRLGCYNYGCCIGKPVQGKLGVVYSDPETKICREIPEFTGITLIPVQLIAAGINLFLFCMSCCIVLFYPFSGLITIIFLLGMNLKRITLQPLRWKDSSNKIPYQWVAFALILICVFIILFFYSSGEVFLREEKTRIPFTTAQYINFLLNDSRIMLPLLFGGMINFVAYGIHGKKLGTHFNISP